MLSETLYEILGHYHNQAPVIHTGKQPNEMGNQHRLRSACTSLKSDQSLFVCIRP